MLNVPLALPLGWSARATWTPLPLPPSYQPLCPRCHTAMAYQPSIQLLRCTGCWLAFQLTNAEALACDAYWFGEGVPPAVSLPVYLAEMALARFGVLA